MDEIVRLEQIEYGYMKNGLNTKVIKNASGLFCKGRVHVITGQSLEEKVVLLALMAGLELPDKGIVLFKGTDIGTVDRDAWRKLNVGLILQACQLIPHFTALENAAMHMEIIGMPAVEYKKTAAILLEKAGFDMSKCGQKARRLNPYEQQRVIVAGALGTKPPLLLIEAANWSADPMLESALGEMLMEIAHAEGACVVIATNSRSIASRADEVWGMKDGILLPLKTLQ